jgi:23S rRNA pseudouridine2605 synthase
LVQTTPKTQAHAGTVSLARALSKLGYCSRKEAEHLIVAGRVRVDGARECSPRRRVRPEHARLSVDGVRVREPSQRTVIAMHKPTGYVTTRTDPAGRPTVYALLTDLGEWVFPVGRLDRDSSGLLILTNDHRLGHALTDPAHHAPKTYHVRVAGVVCGDSLTHLRAGFPLPNGPTTRPAQAQLLGINRDGTSWIEITLTEGRNRQVRRMCAAVGHDVLQLVRVRIAGIDLGDLPSGTWRRLRPDEIARLVRRSGALAR